MPDMGRIDLEMDATPHPVEEVAIKIAEEDAGVGAAEEVAVPEQVYSIELMPLRTLVEEMRAICTEEIAILNAPLEEAFSERMNHVRELVKQKTFVADRIQAMQGTLTNLAPAHEDELADLLGQLKSIMTQNLESTEHKLQISIGVMETLQKAHAAASFDNLVSYDRMGRNTETKKVPVVLNSRA